MKKSILLCYFAACIQIAFTQNKYIDSLQAVLVNTSKPIDRFNIIVKISELHFLLDGGKIDSSTAIQLLKIAQQLKNDSLLAISYNWIGSYFGFVKGDNITSLEYYFKAIPLAESVQDKRRISSLYFDIGLVYFTLQNNEEAGKNIRKGGKTCQISLRPCMIICWCNISAIWLSIIYLKISLILHCIMRRHLKKQAGVLKVSASNMGRFIPMHRFMLKGAIKKWQKCILKKQ